MAAEKSTAAEMAELDAAISKRNKVEQKSDDEHVEEHAEEELKKKYGIGKEHGEVHKLNAQIDLRNKKHKRTSSQKQVELAHADEDHDSDLEDLDEGNADILKAKYGIGAEHCETTALDEAADLRNKRERKRRASLQVTLAHADDEHDSDLEDVDEGNAESLKARYAIGSDHCEKASLEEQVEARNAAAAKRRASVSAERALADAEHYDSDDEDHDEMDAATAARYGLQ